MTCERATALLLEAELAELELRGETELVAHLAGCAACRERARRIVVAERGLSAALDRARPRHDAGAVRRPEARPAGAARPPARRWRVARRAWIPLALAAGIGALILLDAGDEPSTTLSAPSGLESTRERLRVDVPAGRNAVLYETANPDVIVVWFY